METYDYSLEGRIFPALSHYKSEDISHFHINGFLQSLEADEFASATIKKQYNILKSIFKLAQKNDVIKKNPMEKVDPPIVTYKEGQVFNSDELKALYQLLNQEDNKLQALIINLALKTGLRKGGDFGPAMG